MIMNLVFVHFSAALQIRQMGLHVCSTFRLRYGECDPGMSLRATFDSGEAGVGDAVPSFLRFPRLREHIRC